MRRDLPPLPYRSSPQRHHPQTVTSPPRIHSVFENAPPATVNHHHHHPHHHHPSTTSAAAAAGSSSHAQLASSALLSRVPRNPAAAATRRKKKPTVGKTGAGGTTASGGAAGQSLSRSSSSATGQSSTKKRNVAKPPALLSEAEVDAMVLVAAASEDRQQRHRRVRFGDGGDIADAAADAPDPDSEHHHHHHQPHQRHQAHEEDNQDENRNGGSGGGGAAVSSSSSALVQQPPFDPEVALIVKRRLGQENSSRIRLARTVTQLDQELALARKEHSKLHSRAGAIPGYEQQLAALRAEVETLRDDLENLDVEYGILQHRYRDVDAKVDPVVLPAVKNKRRLESSVRETREQQMTSTAALLQRKEKALAAEIARLEQQRESDILQLQAQLNQAANNNVTGNRSNNNNNNNNSCEELPSPTRVRDAALKKEMERVRQEVSAKRADALQSLQARHKEEIRLLAEDEVMRAAQETNKMGAYTNQVNKVEVEATIKKHEVDELALRKAQAIARLAELTADIAVEQQRLLQSAAALAPAKQEADHVQAMLDSSKEHLDRAAVEARTSKKDDQSAAAAAWGVEQAELQRMVDSLEQKAAAMRQREKEAEADLEAKRRQREAATAKRKEEVAALVATHEKRLEECKRQKEKYAADASNANETADKMEHEAAAIEQRLQASQKSEIIMQLQRQHSEINSALEATIRGNSKLDAKLQSVLSQLGDDASMI